MKSIWRLTWLRPSRLSVLGHVLRDHCRRAWEMERKKEREKEFSTFVWASRRSSLGPKKTRAKSGRTAEHLMSLSSSQRPYKTKAWPSADSPVQIKSIAHQQWCVYVSDHPIKAINQAGHWPLPLCMLFDQPALRTAS